ncbi:MAG TPA: hypothetical protein VKU89_01570 [Solirubrobacteraceae bacterium]|nr:hypothetical protein [Solirubrobacteraceae bacterium]
MAATLREDTQLTWQPEHQTTVVASVEEAELTAAQKDSRVQIFLAEADEYLADLDRRGRNR